MGPLWDHYGSSIAVIIHALNPSLSAHLMAFYRKPYFTWNSAGVRELRPLLSIDMPLRWSGQSLLQKKDGGQKISDGSSIAVANHSLDPSLFVRVMDFYRIR